MWKCCTFPPTFFHHAPRTAGRNGYKLLCLLQLCWLLEIAVISLNQDRSDRLCRRPNKDRLGPAGHIAVTSISSHTLRLKAVKCGCAWTTADRADRSWLTHCTNWDALQIFRFSFADYVMGGNKKRSGSASCWEHFLNWRTSKWGILCVKLMCQSALQYPSRKVSLALRFRACAPETAFGQLHTSLARASFYPIDWGWVCHWIGIKVLRLSIKEGGATRGDLSKICLLSEAG